MYLLPAFSYDELRKVEYFSRHCLGAGLPSLVLKFFEHSSGGGIFFLQIFSQPDLFLFYFSSCISTLIILMEQFPHYNWMKKRCGRVWRAETVVDVWNDDRWPNQYSIRRCDFLNSMPVGVWSRMYKSILELTLFLHFYYFHVAVPVAFK